MYKQGLVNPVFSLAVDRGAENEPAGVLALGGIPPEFENLKYSSTPIVKTNLLNNTSISEEYEFYSIYPEGFVYGPSTTSNLTTDPIPSPDTLTTSTLQDLHIVDSGTTLNFLPKAIADGVAAAFIPPAYHSLGVYVVNCNAIPPQFGVQIGDQVFYINPKDMVRMVSGVCFSTVVNGVEEPYILGDPFFKNAVVAFDVGENELRVAGREDY
jgi:hypothetical protein